MEQRIKVILPVTALILLAVFFLASNINFGKKEPYDHFLRPYFLAVTLDDAVSAASLLKSDPIKLQLNLKKIGVNAIILKPGEENNKIIPGLKKIYKVDKEKDINLNKIPDESVIFFSDNIAFDQEAARTKNLIVGNVEFADSRGLQMINPDRVMLLHTMKDKENEKLSVQAKIKRYVRAKEERNARILYVKFDFSKAVCTINPDDFTMTCDFEKALNENFKVISGVVDELKIKGYSSLNENSLLLPQNIPEGMMFPRKALSFALALAFPIFGLFIIKNGKNAFFAFIIFTALSLFGAEIISAVLFEAGFLAKFEQFPWVKIALALPVVVVFSFLVYSERGILRKPAVKYTAVLLVLMIIFMLLRSGNYNMWKFPFEVRIREFLESSFAARPRFKEFLIGHPSFITGFYLYKKEKNPGTKMIAITLLSLGVLGQASIINTFCHVYIPLNLSIMRTIYGAVLGLITGGIGILFCRIVLNLLSNERKRHDKSAGIYV